ncbi:MAG: DNA methyltransferase [Pseudomonadales bacterium]
MNYTLRCGLSEDAFEIKSAIGRAGQSASLLKRKVRWYQQTLKHAGILKRSNQRGIWQLTQNSQLKENRGSIALIAFSTHLGVAIWGACRSVFDNMDAPITLCVTSPPYPLRTARAYGNPTVERYVDFICASLEPIVSTLTADGSLCINISNDIFESRSPARSLYKERLVLALHERLGLWKMDELIWHNPCKAPGPIQWASKTRQQLNVSYEPILWFSPDPAKCKSNNRRVLQPHTESHLKYLASGQRKRVSHSDGAYVRRESSYPLSLGRIPRNVLSYPHNCQDQSAYKQSARFAGLEAHGAPYPLALVKFLIEFMTEKNDLVVDPFGGSMTTAKAAEITNRRWISSEIIHEYVVGGATRFNQSPGFNLNQHIL